MCRCVTDIKITPAALEQLLPKAESGVQDPHDEQDSAAGGDQHPRFISWPSQVLPATQASLLVQAFLLDGSEIHWTIPCSVDDLDFLSDGPPVSAASVLVAGECGCMVLVPSLV